MNALKRVRNIRSGDKLRTTANLLEGPVSTFKELDPDVFISAPVALDVIFVHGLGAKGSADIRRRLKTWLRAVRKTVGCRVWRFGFDGKELLREGRQRLMVLAGNLLKEIRGNSTPQTKPESRKGDRKLVFIGYGAAGWVIQEALAWYSNTSTETARRTAMVILLNLPHMQDTAAFKTYLEKLPPPLHPGKDKPTLEFTIVKIIQDNFEHLVDSSFGPKRRRVFIGAKTGTSPTPSDKSKAEVDLKNDQVLRRETSDTHHTTDSAGSNGTDSSKDSNESGTIEPIPAWDIVAGDETDIKVKDLLRFSLTLEKSDADMIPQPHNQPEYQPISPTYGRFEASRFGFRRATTGLSMTSSNFHTQVRSPPTPPEEIDDPISKTLLPEQHTIVEDSQAVENVRLLIGTAPAMSKSMSGDTLTEDDVESYQERSYTPTQMDTATEMDTIDERDEEVATPEAHPDTKFTSKDVPKVNPPGPSPNWGQLLRLAALYQQSGELQKSKALYERLMDVPALKDGYDIIRCQIAVTWLYEGRAKMAQMVFSELERKGNKSYDKQPQRTWEVRRWLAVSLDMQGLYEQGKKKLMAINDAFGSLQQATDVGLLTRSTLALLFGHLGKYEDALKGSKEVLELAIQAVKTAQGKGDPAYVTRQRGALGSIQFDRAKILTYVGRYEEAETLNDQALENIQRTVGSKHVSTLECWSLKARHFASTCRLPEAEEQCQKTLKVMRTEIGKEHPSTLKTLGVLVYVYRLQARLTEALDTAKYLFEKCKTHEAFGENHPETINSMWQLAEVYLARGDFSNALRYQDQAVELADKVLGKVHPTVVNYRACLARVYCNRGSWTHSASLCFDVLDSYVSIISEAFQSGATNIRKQQKSKSRESDVKDGPKSVIQQTLERARDVLFENNHDFETLNLSLASTIQCLGVTERERQYGDLEVAQELQAKAHQYIEKTLGDDHADTLSSKWDLALTKLKRGQDGALRDLEDVTATRRRILGEDHPDTLAARHQLSVAKFNMSGNVNELAEQAEVLRLCIHLLGDDHPTTNAARIDLSNGYHSAGMITEAEQLRLKALKVQIKTLPHPDLTLPARDSYEGALSLTGLLQDSPHHNGKRSESEYAEEKNEPSDSAPNHCHAQVISSLAALALIYVDMAQAADEAALASVQESDPESETAHRSLVSQFNAKAIALQCAVVDQQELLDDDESTRKERYGDAIAEHVPYMREKWLRGCWSRERLESIYTLGLIYQAAGEIEAAISQYGLVETLADESSILHFTSQSNKGMLLFNEQRYEEAEDIQTQVYNKREKFGKGVVGNKEFVIAGFNLALTKEELGKRDEALGLMEEALKLSRDAFGHTDPTTVRILDTWTEWSENFEEA